MGNALRKLRKKINPEKKPIIMFFPDVKSLYDLKASGAFSLFDAPVITVTDEKIYTRLVAGIKHSQETKQHNVEVQNESNCDV